MRVNNVLVLALGLAGTLSPVWADSIQQTTSSTETLAPRVLDSWMQPTVVRKTEVKNADGESSIKEEPLIWERHEKVEVPVINHESTVTINHQPEVTQTSSVVSQSSTLKATQPVSRLHRHLTAHIQHRAANRAVAYTTVKKSAQVMSTQERTTEKDYVLEQRDPALDL